MTRKGRERSTRSASANNGRWSARGAPSPRKRVASSRMCGSRPTAFRQPWSVNPAGSGGCPESRPCRLRHVTRAHRAPPAWVGPR